MLLSCVILTSWSRFDSQGHCVRAAGHHPLYIKLHLCEWAKCKVPSEHRYEPWTTLAPLFTSPDNFYVPFWHFCFLLAIFFKKKTLAPNMSCLLLGVIRRWVCVILYLYFPIKRCFFAPWTQHQRYIRFSDYRQKLERVSPIYFWLLHFTH